VIDLEYTRAEWLQGDDGTDYVAIVDTRTDEVLLDMRLVDALPVARCITQMAGEAFAAYYPDGRACADGSPPVDAIDYFPGDESLIPAGPAEQPRVRRPRRDYRRDAQRGFCPRGGWWQP